MKESGKPDSLKTYKLNEVVITANRTATPIVETASSITVISEDDIKRADKVSLPDVLNNVAGLSVARQGGPGGLASVFMRGSNSEQTLFLIDGVAVNDPSSINNAYDMSNFPLDNIERVEVLRGPQSTLYGSEAMAGVISIFTKKGSGKPKYSFSLEGGSYETYKANASLNGGISFIDYSLSYSRFDTKGFSAADEKFGNTEKDRNLNNSFFSRAGMKITDYLSLDFMFNYTKAKTGLDQNEKKGDDPNFTYNLEESIFRGAGNLLLFEGAWKQMLAASVMRHISHAVDLSDSLRPNTFSTAFFNGTRIKLDWQNEVKLYGKNKLVFGAESQFEKAATEYNSMSIWGPYYSALNSKMTNTTGLYLEPQLNVKDALFMSLGIRYDYHEKFGSVVTYRIAPAYLFRQTGTKLKATFATGFKLPSLYYLYDPVYGNPDLNPEKSRGYELGAEQYLLGNKLTAGVTFFKNTFYDLMAYDSKSLKTINMEKAESKGFELSLSAWSIYNFDLSLNYSYTDSRNKSPENKEKDLLLIRRPKNKFSFNAGYSLEAASLNLEILSVGGREDQDFELYQRVFLKSYTLVNLAASYQVSAQLKLYGRVDNVFDTKYEEVFTYGTPGLSAYLGLKLNFE
ncbi:MAG: TonB-dependent receptor [Ignavibacteria bacterium]|jgi:vitamin B12 transporter|nr:TonB-dependent receptor [Ignavibacteria bacterium]MCU7518383.1 TonB-dependent receptor [Ignavibacteria bacterium]